MRILHLSPTFPPRTFGGVTREAFLLSKYLADKGHEVTVYTTDVGNAERSRLPAVSITPNMNGIEVHYFRNMSNLLAFRHRIYLSKGILSSIRRELNKFDVVHIHAFRSFHDVIVHHYSKKYDIPYVLESHGATPRMGGLLKRSSKCLFDVTVGHRILSDACKVIALTQTEADQYKSMGVDEDRIEIVPNGIDLSEYVSMPQKGGFRRKYAITQTEKIILYLARIHSIKGPDLLVRAYASLSKDLDNCRLVIVGPDEGYLSTLKRLINDLEIGPKVLLTGPLYGKDKLEAYVDADVYVLPSVYETFPVSVLEACACGTPVVVTDRCGIADLIDQEAGLKVPYDENQLRKAIGMILSNADIRKQFGDNGRNLVRMQFSWQKLVPQIEKIYADCIANRDSSKH